MATKAWPITGDADSDRLLLTDPLALLIGMLLDQQVPMEWAFRGPATLQGRLGGTLDAGEIVQLGPDRLDEIFRDKPALHRYPGSMAKRGRYALCEHIVSEYGGDASRIWKGTRSAETVYGRLRALPGYGEEKAKILLAILVKRWGKTFDGFDTIADPFSDELPRSAADVDSPARLQEVRAFKQRKKANAKQAEDSRVTDDLAMFSHAPFTFEGTTHDVYRGGSGPAVVVIHEVPGITPGVAAFGRRVVDAGFTAVLPSLFGTPGRDVSIPYVLRSLTHGCVSREFTSWALGRTSPVITWLRALARDAHEQCGGPGVGAVGMCFTGGFALAMAVDDAMLAPVLSQPSLPLPPLGSRRGELGLSDADLERVKRRARDDGLCVLGLRFTNDPAVPVQRFDHLRVELGDRFVAVEIDSSKGNPHGISRSAHSVLTEHLVDEPGHPTRDALEQVLDFFSERLSPAGDAST